MQTFLPFSDYKKSAEVLDQKRLGKQRVENLQIMAALILNKGWVNHPATKMWKGYEYSFLHYQEEICREWHLVRGFEDTCLRITTEIFWDAPWLSEGDVAVEPWWLGDPEFHRSHQSNLIRKMPEHYAQIFPGVPNNLPYVWPANLA